MAVSSQIHIGIGINLIGITIGQQNTCRSHKNKNWMQEEQRQKQQQIS